MRERVWVIVSVLFVAAGCGDDREPAPAAVPAVKPPPPPAPPREMKVTKSHPRSGTWGTKYTIEGTALSLANEVTFETPAGEPVTVARNAKDVVAWSDGHITVKVPFPADGKVTVGGLDAGTFASTFAVSKSTFKRGTREPSAMMAIGPDTVVVVATRSSSASAIEPTLYRMHRDAEAEELPVTFKAAVLLRDETGPFAVLETSTFEHARVALDADGDDAAPVAIADLPNERIVGSGSDATGPYVWTTTGTTVTRHRLAAGAWTPDRTVTGTSGSVRALAASGDGNLALFTTVQGGGLLDDYDVVYTQPAGGADAAFGSTAAIMGDVDDSTFGYRVWAKDGGATVVRFCATDEDGVEFDGRSCFTWAKQPSAAAFARVDFLQHDGTGADAATATCDNDTLVVTSGTTKTPVTSPCRDVAAFARGTDGRPIFLAGSRGKYLAVLPKPL